MNIEKRNETFGIDSRNMISQTTNKGMEGAIAALESYYFAINKQAVDELKSILLPGNNASHFHLSENPIEGKSSIAKFYQKLFAKNGYLMLELSEICAYSNDTMALFTGKESGDYSNDKGSAVLNTHCELLFSYTNKGWKLAYLNRNLTEPGILERYQSLI